MRGSEHGSDEDDSLEAERELNNLKVVRSTRFHRSSRRLATRGRRPQGCMRGRDVIEVRWLVCEGGH
jgi:hypothetical protein